MSDDDTVYIGDGVYVDIDDWRGVKLMANDADNPTDTIYLEDYVLIELVKLARIHHVLLPEQTETAS